MSGTVYRSTHEPHIGRPCPGVHSSMSTSLLRWRTVVRAILGGGSGARAGELGAGAVEAGELGAVAGALDACGLPSVGAI